MKRRREVNTVRTDTLEALIARYCAAGNYDAAQAIEDLAESIHAPINTAEITVQIEARRRFYKGRE